MKNLPFMSSFIVSAFVGLLSFGFSPTVSAQENGTEPTIEEKLTIPEYASAKELLTFISETRRYLPKSIMTDDRKIDYLKYMDYQKKQAAAIDKAVDLILVSDDLDVASKHAAFTARIQIVQQKAGNPKAAIEVLQGMIKDLQGDDEMASISEMAQRSIFQIRMSTIGIKNRDEFEQLDKDIRKYFADPKRQGLPQGLSQFSTTMLEKVLLLYADEENQEQIIDSFVANHMPLLSDAEKPRFEGQVRRLKLSGNDMEFETVTIDVKKLRAAAKFVDNVANNDLTTIIDAKESTADGKENFDVLKWADEQPAEKLNLKSLEGKVVLIDCWATWCGPCLAEVPNMLEQYGKYHEKGFEIIGYSCDTNLEALLKFVIKENPPWIIGSTVLSGKQELKNYLNYYGVSGIPTMILIGRDGKVLSTNARGTTLNKLLEEQFAE